ncbi:MAG: GMC oxidoreductase [uncultured bacterium]|nr:MAG: GMC oxidoreductase [uncultured bacterium]
MDQQGHVEKNITIKAQKIVVACGTLESPLLLKRSGLGGKSGQLGKNLSIHPTAKMMGLFDEEVGGDFGVPQGYGIDDYENKGMMFESVFFPPWLLATSIFQSGEAHWNIMKNYRKIGIFGFLVHDDSRGRVVAGPKGRPLIFYNLGNKEKALFVEGLKVLGRLFFAAGAKKLYPTLRTMHEVTNQAMLDKLTPSSVKRRDLESAAFHPLGTCRMGGNKNKSIVNGDLKLHELENVWVVDGSVLPTSLGVNPQITIMAFATRAAEEIHRCL